MKKHLATSLLSLSILASGAAVSAQDAPPPPPTDEQSRAAVADQASDLLARGRAEDARQLLDAYLALTPLPPYAALPVLQRLANRMALRDARLGADPEARPRAPRAERSGVELFELYTMSFVYGGGTGAYLDVLFDIDEVRTAVWIPLVLAGAGLGAAYLVDHGHPVRRGRVSSAGTGTLLGLGLGSTLAMTVNEFRRDARRDCYTVTWPASSDCFSEHRELSGRAVATFAWAGATLGLGAGLGLATLTDATPGQSSMVFAGGLWGATLGLLTSLAADNDDRVGLAMLLGEGLGIGAGVVGAWALRPPESQVRWMNLGVVAGGLLGLGVGILPRSESPAVRAVPIELGMVAGGIAGYLLGAPSRPSQEQGAATARVDRFRATPSVTPVQGGAVVSLDFPHLL